MCDEEHVGIYLNIDNVHKYPALNVMCFNDMKKFNENKSHLKKVMTNIYHIYSFINYSYV